MASDRAEKVIGFTIGERREPSIEKGFFALTISCRSIAQKKETRFRATGELLRAYGFKFRV